jgi:crotonobetainyl-CoA:carnitine CoA-transferase CaiB-like acyl-CoA transferase
MREHVFDAPLRGLSVVELSHGVAAGYAGRLLATLGAETVLVEPPDGNALRAEPPFLDEREKASALFAYIAAGKQSVVCDLKTAGGRDDLSSLLARADVFVTDLTLAERASLGLDAPTFKAAYPSVVDVSVLPFGAHGAKAGWRGEEINLIHASGEGLLLPNGLSAELFPDRPPLKVYGHFAEYQGGIVAALGALCALLECDRPLADGVDVSIQDAMLAVGAFAVQRFGDGSLEHRLTRSFKYGGVLECADGYVELLTLEDRQWRGLVELMGRPAWALDPALSDSLERSRLGQDINVRIRDWARRQLTAEVVAQAQRLGVPMAKYSSPAEVLLGPHEHARRLFQEVYIPGFGFLPMLVAPFHFDGGGLVMTSGPPRLGQQQSLLQADPGRELARAGEGL